MLADQADMDGASALAALASAASLAQNTSVKQEAKGIKNEYDEVRTNRTYTVTKIPFIYSLFSGNWAASVPVSTFMCL